MRKYKTLTLVAVFISSAAFSMHENEQQQVKNHVIDQQGQVWEAICNEYDDPYTTKDGVWTLVHKNKSRALYNKNTKEIIIIFKDKGFNSFQFNLFQSNSFQSKSLKQVQNDSLFVTPSGYLAQYNSKVLTCNAKPEGDNIAFGGCDIQSVQSKVRPNFFHFFKDESLKIIKLYTTYDEKNLVFNDGEGHATIVNVETGIINYLNHPEYFVHSPEGYVLQNNDGSLMRYSANDDTLICEKNNISTPEMFSCLSTSFDLKNNHLIRFNGFSALKGIIIALYNFNGNHIQLCNSCLNKVTNEQIITLNPIKINCSTDTFFFTVKQGLITKLFIIDPSQFTLNKDENNKQDVTAYDLTSTGKKAEYTCYTPLGILRLNLKTKVITNITLPIKNNQFSNIDIITQD